MKVFVKDLNGDKGLQKRVNKVNTLLKIGTSKKAEKKVVKKIGEKKKKTESKSLMTKID